MIFKPLVGFLGGPLEPIMQFQTDMDGTFNPSITLSSGTLTWVIDGVRYSNTNSPSVALTGDTVDVYVYRNTVPETVTATFVDMDNLNIIGTLDFSWATISGNFYVQANSDLTSLIFSSSGNSSSDFQARECNLSALDVSSFTFSDRFWAYNNSNLTSITFSSSGNSSNEFRMQLCNLSSLDVSSFTFSGKFIVNNNTNLSSITFSGSGNSSSTFNVRNTSLSSLDISSFTLSGNFLANSNSSLTSITFSSSGNSSSNFQANDCNFSTLDVSSFTFSGNFWVYSNSSLSAITWGSITTGIEDIQLQGCDLPESEVDELYALLESFFSSNTPVKDLSANTSGGTNEAPSASGDADITATEGYFTTEGYTFTATTA